MQELTMNEMMEINGGQGHGDKKRTIADTSGAMGKLSTSNGYIATMTAVTAAVAAFVPPVAVVSAGFGLALYLNS